MSEKNVCVIGGGIGGITAAYTLLKKGHNVTVFERGRAVDFKDGVEIKSQVFDSGVGGKCLSPCINGKAYEMGACSCAPGFETIIRFARQTGLHLKKRMPFKVLLKDRGMVSFRDQYWPLDKTFLILREMLVYIFHAVWFSIFNNRRSGYRSIPARYCVSFMEFCKKRSLKTIPYWFELPVVSFGYGRLNTIEIWYVLNYINAFNFLGIAFLLILLGIPPVRKIDKGYETLLRRIAEDIDIRAHHQVIRVVREDKVYVTVENLDTHETETHMFDALVVSVPLPEIAPAMDFNEKEMQISNAVVSYPYTIAACEIHPIDDECLLLRENVDRPGHVALIEETIKGVDGFCVCYIPEISRDRSIADIIDGLRDDLKAFGATLGKVHDIRKWNYFPHFKDADSYGDFYGLQGKRNTWYVGALATFELAECVAGHAEALMEASFTGNSPKELFSKIRNLFYFYFASKNV